MEQDLNSGASSTHLRSRTSGCATEPSTGLRCATGGPRSRRTSRIRHLHHLRRRRGVATTGNNHSVTDPSKKMHLYSFDGSPPSPRFRFSWSLDRGRPGRPGRRGRRVATGSRNRRPDAAASRPRRRHAPPQRRRAVGHKLAPADAGARRFRARHPSLLRAREPPRATGEARKAWGAVRARRGPAAGPPRQHFGPRRRLVSNAPGPAARKAPLARGARPGPGGDPGARSGCGGGNARCAAAAARF